MSLSVATKFTKLHSFYKLFSAVNKQNGLHSNRLIFHDSNYFGNLQLFHSHFAGIHINHQLLAKSFKETENEYAHSILENIPAYAKSIVKQSFKVDINAFKNCPKEIEEFSKVTMECVSKNINLYDKQFTPLVLNIVKQIPQLSDEDIIKCMYLLCCWPPTPKTWTPNFKVLWNNLDKECVKRLQYWDTSKKLLVADYWFSLRLNRITWYNRHMIVNILQNINEVTNSEMVQFMFYINLQREIPTESLGILEKRLLNTVKEISMKELGLVCYGFFKTKYKANNFSISEVVINRLTKDIEITEEFTIVALFKFLKKSMNLSYTESYLPLLHKCVSQVQKWKVKTCIHCALLTSECHVYHPLLLNAIIENVACNIEEARLKDCMKLLQCLAHFNHLPCEKFNHLLLSEIKKESRQEEIISYPKDLIYISLYYAYLGYYNHDILNIVLSSNYVENCLDKFPELSITFAEVDCCVEIECKDYKGNRLPREYWETLSRRRGNIDFNSDKPDTLTRLSNEMMQSLKIIMGKDKSIILKHLLPHTFSPDIVIPLFGEPNLVFSDKEIFVPPLDEVWVCFVIGVPFSFTYRSKHKTGVISMKLRQLESLGYKIIFIPHYELPRHPEKQIHYLKEKLECISKCTKSKFSLKK